MSSSIEERIIQMRFNNGQFEKGAKESLKTLDKLDTVLDQLGSRGGVDHIGNALSSLEHRFSAFGIAGMTAVEKVTSSVLNLAKNLALAIPNQIITGGKTRALNIEQAQFQLKGLGVAWEDVSDDIDHAVMGTAYGMDEAAKVASQLAATGIEYKNITGEISDMGKALRGISGVAAMTNSSYADIGDIFLTVFGNGKLGTMQLQQFASRGLNVAAKLAEVLSDGPDKIKYTEEEIRKMISKGEIDALTFAKAMDYAFGEHATAANETYTGSLSNMKAALSRIGADFSTPVLNGLRDIQNALRMTFDRLRKVTKPFAEGTFAEWMSRAAELGVRLANSIDFSGLQPLLDVVGKGLNKGLDGVEKMINTLQRLFKVRNDIATGEGEFWVNTAAQRRVENIRAIFEGLVSVIQNVVDAIGIFKKQFDGTGIGLLKFGDSILEVAGNVGRFLKTYEGMFRGFHDLGMDEDGNQQFWIDNKAVERIKRIQEFADKVKALFGPIGRIVKASSEILKTAISDILNIITSKGPSSVSIFESVYNVILKVLEKLAYWTEALRDAVVNHQLFSKIITGIGNAFNGIYGFISKASSAVGGFIRELFDLKEGETAWSKIAGGLQTAGAKISEVFNNIKTSLSGAFSKDGSGTNVISLAGTLLATLLGYRKIEKTGWAIGRLKRRFDVLGGGIDGIWNTLANLPDKILTVIGRASGALRAFSDNLNAKSLLAIAGAVAVLAAGLWVIASIDAEKLAGSLGAVAASLGLLVGAFSLIVGLMGGISQYTFGWKWIFQDIGNSINKSIKARNMKQAATAIILVAAAVLVLALAIKIFSKIPTEDLVKGVAAAAAAILILVGALALIGQIIKTLNPVSIIAAGAAILIMAVGVVILTAALWALSLIPYDRMVTAVEGLALGLAVLVVMLLVLSDAGANALAAAGSILILSVALVVLVAAVFLMSLIPFDKMMDSLLGLALGLAAMSLALYGLAAAGPMVIVAALALLVVSVSLVVMAAALVIFVYALKQLESVKLGKVVLALLALVVPLMLLGAAGLVFGLAGVGFLAASIGLLVLAKALQALGNVKVAKISLQLIALVPALMLLGVAGIVFGLGGAGLALGGAGLMVLAIALNMLNGLPIGTLAGQLALLAPALMLLGIGGLVFGLGGAGMIIGGVGLLFLAGGLKAMDGVTIDAGYLAKLGAALVILGLGGTFLLLGATGLAVGGPALEAFGSALPTLSAGLQTMEGINWETIGKAFFILAESIGALLLLQFATLADGSAQLANFGSALPSLSAGISTMSDIPWDAIGKAFAVLAEGIGALLLLDLVGFSGGPAMLADLGNALIPLSDGVKAIAELRWGELAKAFTALAGGIGTLMAANLTGSADLVSIGDGLLLIAQALNALPENARDILNGLRTGVINGKADILSAVAEVMSAAVDSIGSSAVQFQTAGGVVPVSIANGIGMGVGTVLAAMSSLVNLMISSIDVNTANWQILGHNISVGIANGISEGAVLAVEAVSALATAIENRLRAEMGIRSPSRVMHRLGQYISQGLGNGIASEASSIESSTITAISPMLAILQALANGDYDISPTIRPVVDLTNLSAAAGSIDDMSGGFSIPASFASSISSRIDDVERVASTMAGTTQNYSGDNITFNIYASEGMDENAIADAVMNRMQTRMVRRSAAFG